MLRELQDGALDGPRALATGPGGRDQPGLCVADRTRRSRTALRTADGRYLPDRFGTTYVRQSLPSRGAWPRPGQRRCRTTAPGPTRTWACWEESFNATRRP